MNTLKKILLKKILWGFNKEQRRTALVVQWLGNWMPKQGTWVRSPLREDPTCRGTIKPMSHNYRARSLQSLLHKSGHQNVTPEHLSQEEPAATRESLHAATKTHHGQSINKSILKKKKKDWNWMFSKEEWQLKDVQKLLETHLTHNEMMAEDSSSALGCLPSLLPEMLTPHPTWHRLCL